MLITSQKPRVSRELLESAFVGFKVVVDAAFDTAASDWDAIATEVPSNTSVEVYPWLGRSSQFREWVGNRVHQKLDAHSFAIVNKTFENTVEIPVERFEDRQYGIFSPQFKQIGMDAKNHPDTLVFSLLQNGNAGLCYDDKPFFSTTHPGWDKNGKQIAVSNVDASGTGPWWFLFDGSKAIKPLIFQKRRDYRFISRFRPDDPNVFEMNTFIYGIDCRVNVGYGLWQLAYASNNTLNSANYQAARAALRSIRNENGLSMNVRPNVLLVGPPNEGPGNTVLKAETINATTNIWRDTAKLVCTNWLD